MNIGIFFILFPILLALVAIYNISLSYSLLITLLCLSPVSAMMHRSVPGISNFGLAIIVFSFLLFFKEKTITNKIGIKLLIIYSLTCLILFILSTEVPKQTQITLYVDEFVNILFALEAFIVFKRKSEINHLILTILISVFLISGYALYVYISGNNIYVNVIDSFYKVKDNEFRVDGLESSRGFIGVRFQSVFEHSLTLGQLFSLFFNFLILIRFELNKWSLRLSLITIMTIIFFTGSRSAIISLTPTLFFLYTQLKWKNQYFFLLTCLLFFSAIEFNFLNLDKSVTSSLRASVFFWDNDLQEKANFDGSSVSLRIKQFEAVFKKLEHTNPLVGYGRGFREYYQKKIHGLDKDLLGYEGIFLLKPVEQGLLGILFFFYFLYKIYFYLINRSTWLYGNEIFYTKIYFLSYIIGIIMTGMRLYSLLFFMLFIIIYSQYLQINKYMFNKN